MQVNISSGREQKVGWLLSQEQAWVSSTMAKSIIFVPSSSPRERSSARAGF